MKVYIVCYAGTIYEVFTTWEDAQVYADAKFGESALLALSCTIVEREVVTDFREIK